ncbi:MAG: hypothetical protein EOS03_00565 [Mesorhizobium sp.]|uniref:HEPN domain-containing protein n=1 Tax=Mesorhizobium sp. TaxID=1871066 RepID=UPI000FE4A951|nr:HEPN domain-containing protein [Mesorhizobium sp.]RWN48987.1 MAG: hypothetical protein EOS03_00565 [Mesorhizobium sp.]
MAKCFIVSPFGIDQGSLPGGTHYVNDEIKLEPLSDVLKARLVDYLDTVKLEDLSQLVRQKPVYVVPNSSFSISKDSSDAEATDEVLQLHRFTAEQFAGAVVPMAAFNFDGEKVLAHSFDRTDLMAGNVPVQMNALAWESHLTYLGFVYKRIGKATSAPLAIRRLCRANRAGPSSEGIIDLAISLECLVNAQTEIKFQFALNHALTNSDDMASRFGAFELLQSLYDLRSTVVHGGVMGKADKKKLAVITDKWPELMSISRNSITYYLHFCAKYDHASWAVHLRKLALGDTRVGLEDAP